MNVKYILNKIKIKQNIYSNIELSKLLKVSKSAVFSWKSKQNC